MAEPVVSDNLKEYSKNTVLTNINSFIVNKGNRVRNVEFDNYDTHVVMCYEYSEIQILETSDNDNSSTDILISNE